MKLISLSGTARGARRSTLLKFDRGQGELGESLGEIVSGLVDMIGRTVVEQVPDHLNAGRSAASSAGSPARPVVFARRFLDQVPAKAVADVCSGRARAQPISCDMSVVTRRPDQVEANAVTAPMRRAFEAGLEEAGKSVSGPS